MKPLVQQLALPHVHALKIFSVTITCASFHFPLKNTWHV